MNKIDYKSEIKGNENIEFVYPQTPDVKIISAGWLFPTIASLVALLLAVLLVALCFCNVALCFCNVALSCELILPFLIVLIVLLLVVYMVYRVTVVQITKLNEQQILEISSRRKMIEAAITNVISLQVKQIEKRLGDKDANDQKK